MRSISLPRVASIAAVPLALVLLGGAIPPATAAAPAPTLESARSAVDERIAAGVTARLSAPALGSTVAVHVIDIARGTRIVDRAASRPFLPASTMKVMTGVAAVATMGANHRFVTRVVRGDDPGEIILVGGGDPLLSRADLATLAKRTLRSLRKQGGIPSRITVRVDDSLFPAPTNAWGWVGNDMPVYASAVRPLALLGDYSTDTRIAASGAFATALRARGPSVVVAGTEAAGPGARSLGRTPGSTVGESVDIMLRVSENNVAEILFRQVALATGRPASWSGAAIAQRTVLSGLGIPMQGAVFADGSGLSQQDRLTAKSLTAVLSLVQRDARFATVKQGLPIAGETGTLTYRFSSQPASCARGRVLAKTGSLTGVNTLAGLTRGTDGRWKAFAVLVNKRPAAYANASTSAAIDAIAATVHGCA